MTITETITETTTESNAAGAGALTAVRTFRTVPSPVGPLLLVGGASGLTRVAFAGEDHERVLAAAGPVRPDTGELDTAAHRLGEYFAGHLRTFDLPLDPGDLPPFRRRVLDVLREIPYGATLTYAGLAERAGNPRAVRAAASACATNPLPIVVPCHRIVPAGGGIGRYLGGEPAKRRLIDLETDTLAGSTTPY